MNKYVIYNGGLAIVNLVGYTIAMMNGAAIAGAVLFATFLITLFATAISWNRS